MRPLGRTSDSVAELYERSRPGYPPALFAALGEPGRALEIGAGTGQATRGLLARGWDVVAHIAATRAQRDALLADVRARIAARGGAVRKHHLRLLQTAARRS